MLYLFNPDQQGEGDLHPICLPNQISACFFFFQGVPENSASGEATVLTDKSRMEILKERRKQKKQQRQEKEWKKKWMTYWYVLMASCVFHVGQVKDFYVSIQQFKYSVIILSI